MSSSAASHGHEGVDKLEVGPSDTTGSSTLNTDNPSVETADRGSPTVPTGGLAQHGITASASAPVHALGPWELAFLKRGIELPPMRTSPTEIHAQWKEGNLDEFLSKYAVACRKVDPAISTLQSARDGSPGSVDTTEAMSDILDFCNMSSMMYVEARPTLFRDCTFAESERVQISFCYAREAHFWASWKLGRLLHPLMKASDTDAGQSSKTLSIIEVLKESRKGMKRYEQLSFKLTSRYRDRDWHDCFPRWKLDGSSYNEGVKVVADEIQQVITSEPLLATWQSDGVGIGSGVDNVRQISFTELHLMPI